MAADTISNLKRHFPGTGNSYQIAHDGECLIIKNVEIKGRLYDIKIRQKDEYGQIKKTSSKDLYYQGSIVRIAQAAAELFSHLEQDYIPTIKFTFSNAGQDPEEKYSCSSEDMMKESNDESRLWTYYSGRDLPKVDDKLECAKVVQSAATIHSILFDDTGLVAGDESDLISPVYEHKVEWDRSKYIRHEEYLAEEVDDDNDEGEAFLEVARSQPQSSLDEESFQVVQATPIDPDDATEDEDEDETFQTPSSPPGLSPVPQDPQEPDWLRGITYEGLVQYSRNPTNSGPHHKPYQHFNNLLKEPRSKNIDDQQMLNWLRRLYVQKYRKKTEDTWRKKSMRNQKFEEWRKDISAKEIVQGIESHIRSNSLVSALQETNI